MRFLRIDCGPLKQTLVGHCEQWVSKFTGLLLQLASAELASLHESFKAKWVVWNKQKSSLTLCATPLPPAPAFLLLCERR